MLGLIYAAIGLFLSSNNKHVLYIKSFELSCFRWVVNHYKWIVWKLASLERCYPTRAGGKFLTVANIIEELKYR
jgi:hypothetical protein